MRRADEQAIPETPAPAATPAMPEERPTSGRRLRPRAAEVAAEGAALSGAALLQQQAATLPNAPGVYRMLDARGDVLYVGKAKSLRKRVPAYAKPAALSARLQRMVALTRALEVVTTASDVEALLLECNM
ncbi:MAG: excinuclease ABC subunit UvrC, partial [Geminicoccaceae bacterium]